MKITRLLMSSENSTETIEFSYIDPTASNPYNVKKVLGLDAPDIIPRYYGSSSAFIGDNNSPYYSLTLGARQIVILVKLNPQFNTNQSYSDLRDGLYRQIVSSKSGRIVLYFVDDSTGTPQTKVQSSGVVQKVESDPFSQDQTVQLTINLDDPLLRGPDPYILSVGGVASSEFNVSDEVSTAPHGLTVSFKITGNIAPGEEFTVYDPSDPLNWYFTLNPSYNLIANDIITISSDYEKSVVLTRAGVDTPIADAIVAGSIWPTMFPGVNQFGVVQASRTLVNSFSYYPTYWGI